jgi:hypothetical protein
MTPVLGIRQSDEVAGRIVGDELTELGDLSSMAVEQVSSDFLGWVRWLPVEVDKRQARLLWKSWCAGS